MDKKDLAKIACPSLKDLWDQEIVKVGPCHTPESAFEAGYKAGIKDFRREVQKIIAEHPAVPEIFEGTRDSLDRISLTKRQAD